MQTMIGKLLQHDKAAEKDLLEVFGLIDDNSSINLRRMTDSYVQLKLHKIFTLLKM